MSINFQLKILNNLIYFSSLEKSKKYIHLNNYNAHQCDALLLIICIHKCESFAFSQNLTYKHFA